MNIAKAITKAVIKNGGEYDLDIPGVELLETIGGEDEGSYYAAIFTYKGAEENVRYFRIVGHYNSWNGTDWEGAEAEEVVPYEKITRDWKVKE